MEIVLLALPHIVSWVLGYAVIDRLSDKPTRDPYTRLFLAWAFGIGLSAYICFFSFVFFNVYSKFFIFFTHCLLLLVVIWPRFKEDATIYDILSAFKKLSALNVKMLACLGLLLLFMIPVGAFAMYYPFGGWDAWNVWNFKAKFLFEAPPGIWRNIFHPTLWRSSPHYPLLLPMMNVWGWSFINESGNKGPLVTAILFTFCTSGLLFTTLKKLTRTFSIILAPLLLISLPFYVTLATNQYCDIVLGLYIFAGLYCLTELLRGNSSVYALLGGSFLGLLSFTKPEGLVCASLILFLFFSLVIWRKLQTSQWILSKRAGCTFIGAFFISALPTIIFNIFYAPHNITFINGLISRTSPSTFLRFKFIMAFFFVEMGSKKWQGLLLLLLFGILFSVRKPQKGTLIFPLFLLSYGGILILYYFTNTYFKIDWWLQVTLNRIIFSLLPTILFWVFYTLCAKRKGLEQPPV